LLLAGVGARGFFSIHLSFACGFFLHVSIFGDIPAGPRLRGDATLSFSLLIFFMLET